MGLLGVAEALESGPSAIQAWPFDEETFARVVANQLVGDHRQVLQAPFT